MEQTQNGWLKTIKVYYFLILLVSYRLSHLVCVCVTSRGNRGKNGNSREKIFKPLLAIVKYIFVTNKLLILCSTIYHRKKIEVCF